MRLACHLLYGLILALPFPLLALASRQALVRHWSRALLHILNIQLEINGAPPSAREIGALLVANHISWLDVFVINAASPACFVAKSEVRSWPLIGLLCKLTRTVFIERSLKRDTLRANWAITRTLIRGESVALFPEGTSTNGCQVRVFHSSLLQCAIDAATCVQPVAIRYHNGAGLRSYDACYIGDMNLMQSLRNILRSRSLHVQLTFLPQLASHGKTRRTLSDQAYDAIHLTLHVGLEDSVPAKVLQPAIPEPARKSAHLLMLDPIGEFKHLRHL